VLEATGRHLRCAAAAGDKQRQLRTMVLQADASLGSTSGVSQMVPGWFRKGNPNQAHLTALGIRVGPVLPLRAHGQMVGFLGVGTNHHSQRLPGEALSLLAFLSSRASLEIERLQPSVADRLDYEAAVRSAPQGICVLRAGGEILAANPAVGTMVGRDPWDLAGESWRHLLPDGEWQRLQHVLEDVSITGERKDLDIEIRTEQNYRRQIRFSLALTTPAGPGLQDRGRGPDKIVAILEDVTSLRILEQERLAHLEELRQKNVALQELDRLKSQFVSNVSHELRNPLAVIKLYSALARKGRPDKQDHYLQTIERETHRLETLVENVLSLSRLDRGALELNLEPLNVSTIVQNVVDVYQVSARAKGIELQNRVTPPTPTLWADESQLIQILTNLLDNALKFTPAGGEVWIDAAQAGEPVQPLLEISVGDTGPGIPPDEQDKVFERFYRGKNSSPTTSGTGIGLSIVREMMEQHGGQVLLDSPPGEGCTFRLLFSLADPSN
jgi:PAS domain S-box-containing protein